MPLPTRKQGYRTGISKWEVSYAIYREKNHENGHSNTRDKYLQLLENMKRNFRRVIARKMRHEFRPCRVTCVHKDLRYIPQCFSDVFTIHFSLFSSFHKLLLDYFSKNSAIGCFQILLLWVGPSSTVFPFCCSD